MSSKVYALILAASFFSVSANASKARLTSLAQSANGSQYLEDTRSVFLNPGYLSKMGEWANFEMGGTTTPSSPNAEGGYIKSLGSMKAGFQLGRQGTTTNAISLANSTSSGLSFISPQNVIEILVGGGDSMAWGFSVLYGTAEDNAEKPAGTSGNTYPNKKANTFEARGGVVTDAFNAYGHLNLIGTSDNEASATGTRKFAARPGIRLGGAFNLSEDRKIYGDLDWEGWNVKNEGSTIDTDTTLFTLLVGIVEFVNVEQGTRLFYTPAFEISNYNIKDNKGGPETKEEHIRIPLTVGLESDANEWLTLRASVTQKVIIDSTKTTVTSSHNPNTTTVAAGAGLKWKKLILDATLAGSSTGTINGNSLFTNAALTYKF